MTDKRPGICYLRSNLESKKAKKELEGSTTNSTKFEITGTTQGEQKTAKRATKARPIGRLGTTYPYTPSSYRVSLRLSQIVNPGEKEIDLFHSLALFVVFLRFLFAPKKLPTCEGVKRVFFFRERQNALGQEMANSDFSPLRKDCFAHERNWTGKRAK